MFYIIGIGINLFLWALLVSKKRKSLADKILTVWLFVIACHLSLFALSLQPVTITSIHQIGLGIPFPFLHGPFLYLYTAAVTNQLPSNKKLWWLHFIPAFLVCLMILPLITKSAEEKMQVFLSKGKEFETQRLIAAWFMQLSGIIYAAWAFYLLHLHKKRIGRLFSYEERINLNWLRYLIYSLSVVWVIIILVQKDSFIFAGVVAFIILLGFFGIRQVGIFGQTPNISNVNPGIDLAPTVSRFDQSENTEPQATLEPSLSVQISGTEIKRKYASSGLSETMVVEIHDRLKNLMETDKLYTEAELSLSQLAERLRVHPNYLSQVINEKEGKSFFDYINFLRIQEFKRLVAQPNSSQFTIMSMAYDCGFNSKSTFNKNFKKVTGLSPSDYMATTRNTNSIE